MPWYSGTTSDGEYEYAVARYMLPDGQIIDGPPSDLSSATSLLIAVQPVDDEEATRYFWVHGAKRGSPERWLRNIAVFASSHYEIDLAFDYDGEDE